MIDLTVNKDALNRAVERAKERNIIIPTFKRQRDPSLIPEKIVREKKPNLPELSQPQVLRHYLHLSQMVLGTDVTIDIGLGTCTMKYSPKIHEASFVLPYFAQKMFETI